MRDGEQDHQRVGAAGQGDEGGVEQRDSKQTKGSQRDKEI